MLLPFSILAEDSGLVKFVFFVIFAIIWGIGALASTIKKANEQARRRAALRPQAQQPQQPPVQAAQPQRAIPVRRIVAPPQRQAAPRQQVARRATPPSLLQRAQVLTNMVRPAAAPAPRQPQPPPLVPARPATNLAKPSAAVAAVSHTTPGGASAAAIRNWLRPVSLRKQFILTELLQPPISLREKPES
jgi:hypothetical protein